jgi:hypothetical protein
VSADDVEPAEEESAEDEPSTESDDETLEEQPVAEAEVSPEPRKRGGRTKKRDEVSDSAED